MQRPATQPIHPQKVRQVALGFPKPPRKPIGRQKLQKLTTIDTLRIFEKKLSTRCQSNQSLFLATLHSGFYMFLPVALRFRAFWLGTFQSLNPPSLLITSKASS